MCFGRKEPGDLTVSKAELQYLQKEKELKEIMERLEEKDTRIISMILYIVNGPININHHNHLSLYHYYLLITHYFHF